MKRGIPVKGAIKVLALLAIGAGVGLFAGNYLLKQSLADTEAALSLAAEIEEEEIPREVIEVVVPPGNPFVGCEELRIPESLRDRILDLNSREAAISNRELELQLQIVETTEMITELHEARLTASRSDEAAPPEAAPPEAAPPGVSVATGEAEEVGGEGAVGSEASRGERLDGVGMTLLAMNPEAAAQVISEFEPALAAEILAQLSPRGGGRILNSMPSEVAARLSERIINSGGVAQ